MHTVLNLYEYLIFFFSASAVTVSVVLIKVLPFSSPNCSLESVTDMGDMCISTALS
jgi:hypothetical protein